MKKNIPAKRTGRNFLEVDELDGPRLAHRPHRIDDVVLQGVDPVPLVQGDGAHGLLTHGTLVRVTWTLKRMVEFDLSP